MGINGHLEDWLPERQPPVVDRSVSGTTRIGFVREEDGNFFALVVLDEQTGDTVEIQRMIEPFDQDRDGGTDGYCIIHGSELSRYGGVLSFAVSAEELTLVLAPDAADFLGLPQHLTFPVDPSYAPALRAHLDELLLT